MKNLTLTRIPTDQDCQIVDLLLEGDQILDPKDLPNCKLPPDINWN